MSIEITILGCGSATPTLNRNPSSQFVKIATKGILIDCGEGTQRSLTVNAISINAIDIILISHLHGDHYFGLPGLLSTMQLMGRKNKLTIFANFNLAEILTTIFRYSGTQILFELNFEPLIPYTHQLIFSDNKIKIESFPLNHRIDCWGFTILENQRLRNLIKEKMPPNLKIAHIAILKKGMDVVENNEVIYYSDELTLPAPKVKSYSYCSDTIYDESIIPYIKDVDLLYHESTFHSDEITRATRTYHSTAHQAAQIALKANVKKLLIGHFSSRYKNLDLLLEEAKLIFPNTVLAKDNLIVKIDDANQTK